MSKPVLQACGLGKSFFQGGNQLCVLREIEFSLAAGEFVAVVGASGSGKSTLMHLLGGLDEPSSGEVKVTGESLASLNQRQLSEIRNRHLGFVYQFHHLLPEFTALDNVAMPLLIRGDAPAEARQQAAEVLGQLGLAPRLQHRPGQLSGGERQRTAMARALVTAPSCLLADEPTGNLDQTTAAAVLDTLLELRRRLGTALLLVTHDPDIAAQADRVLLLTGGILRPA
ncbi:MAG: ATP-binding cassette domain-containing protein [Gammaproteobacteria bacterium]|nr:ATP-binding cassette domain-containing protein [Gammaproteobacteria bacterium]